MNLPERFFQVLPKVAQDAITEYRRTPKDTRERAAAFVRCCIFLGNAGHTAKDLRQAQALLAAVSCGAREIPIGGRNQFMDLLVPAKPAAPAPAAPAARASRASDLPTRPGKFSTPAAHRAWNDAVLEKAAALAPRSSAWAALADLGTDEAREAYYAENMLTLITDEGKVEAGAAAPAVVVPVPAAPVANTREARLLALAKEYEAFPRSAVAERQKFYAAHANDLFAAARLLAAADHQARRERLRQASLSAKA